MESLILNPLNQNSGEQLVIRFHQSCIHVVSQFGCKQRPFIVSIFFFENYWYRVWKFLNGKPASLQYSNSWFSIEVLPNSLIFQSFSICKKSNVSYLQPNWELCECMIAWSELTTACGRLDSRDCVSMKLVVKRTFKNSSSHWFIYTMQK